MSRKPNAVQIQEQQNLQETTLIVGWTDDAGQLGTGVTDYLIDKLGGEEIARIDLPDFFSMGGVAVKGDVAQLPQSRFHYCSEKNLVILRSDVPTSEWYEFLNTILDVAEHYCHGKEVYTIGSMLFMGVHTTLRQLTALPNSPAMKQVMAQYGLAFDMDYDSPVGQRPSLNSFLSWAAKRRNIPAVGLWVPVPFYLVSAEYPQGWKQALQFFNARLDLGIGLTELEDEVLRQNEKIAEARRVDPEVNKCIGMLERNITLSQEENEQLVRRIREFLAQWP